MQHTLGSFHGVQYPSAVRLAGIMLEDLRLLRNQHIILERLQAPVMPEFLATVPRCRRIGKHFEDDLGVEQRVLPFIFETQLATGDKRVRVGIKSRRLDFDPHVAIENLTSSSTEPLGYGPDQ